MARQTIGTPKFYIDNLSYQNMKGNISGVGDPYVQENGDVSGNTSEDGHMAGNMGHYPSIVGLNPSNYASIITDFTVDGSGQAFSELRIQFVEPISAVYSDTKKCFFGVLGHNLGDYNHTISAIRFGDELGNPIATVTHEGVFYPGIDNYATIENIQNFMHPILNGWSLARFIAGQSLKDIKTITFRFRGGLGEKNPLIGSLCFGEIFEMPHSPDLKLSMTREFDGIKQQETMGGGTLTQIKYDGPPEWVQLPAWGLDENPIGTANPQKFPSRGRRLWDLQFSYIGSSDMFPLNEMGSMYNQSDTIYDDSDYDSEVWEADGNFKDEYKSESESTFLTSIISRSMGGAIPFIFQPNGNDYTPQGFALCNIVGDSISFEQVANSVYNVKLKIREVW